MLIEKLETGIEGFEHISNGGLPKNRTTLIAGTAGSAKTVFAAQFLVEGIRQHGEAGVFVTFEELPDDIRRNMLGFGWSIQEWEQEQKWAFIDAAPRPSDDSIIAGDYDLGGLLARIENAVTHLKAKRVSLDSIGAILNRFQDLGIFRRELFRISSALKTMGVTAIMTAERTAEYGDIARYGVEEFVADNVIILRNVLEHEKRRRTVEILKFRGTSHQKGEFPFTIDPQQGIIVIPISAIELKQKSSDTRITSGVAELDKMCGGGFFRDSIILVSGPTGNGKTLLATQFIAGGVSNDERCLLFAFEESREQLFRNAIGWGIDFEQFEKKGKLKVMCEYPEVTSLEDHLIRMKDAIVEFKPNRVAVDSLSALERVSTIRGFREFVIGLTSYIKHHEVVGLFTATTPSLMGGTSVTESHISTITDSIILLRYVEMFGEMHRGLTVLKMRGSIHEKEIREFMIDDKGLHLGKPFRNIIGILSGNPQHFVSSEEDRLGGMFQDPSGATLP
ncbi:putative circadian clock protein, KaiC [Chloroherpeton thalassium ATCC 35110]|uniref:non-specific serine/threonine protein kinase n=1 Tax=Chloroherpeton thalassium (strain ATCC 35110 / GB-78) TaxID=517418 RepID=B3QX04_CHLT3|nr:circadian clock protein KaiC [Chloroherpeton thalassium]ACF14814.1 putative circadian clock protein, KaiC [Chloroherpeton thalassium ATCC 35110]